MRFILLCTVIAAGCTTTPPHSEPASPGSGTATPPNIEDWLDQAEPALQAAGCIACHGQATSAAPGFMAGATALDLRETLLDSGLIDLADPAASMLLNKGVHEGPPFTSDDLIVLIAWISAEAAAAN
jgi:hypothetical protein